MKKSQYKKVIDDMAAKIRHYQAYNKNLLNRLRSCESALMKSSDNFDRRYGALKLDSAIKDISLSACRAQMAHDAEKLKKLQAACDNKDEGIKILQGDIKRLAQERNTVAEAYDELANGIKERQRPITRQDLWELNFTPNGTHDENMVHSRLPNMFLTEVENEWRVYCEPLFITEVENERRVYCEPTLIAKLPTLGTLYGFWALVTGESLDSIAKS